jgi:protein TonB
MTLGEMLREQQTQDERGPNRRVEDIVRDYLDEQTLPPGEDRVSFNSLNMKYESYFYRFARAIYGLWKYPPEAAMRGEAGIVRVTFSITKEGKLTNIRMLESSGYPSLDREVMRVLRNMPELPLPDSLGLNVLHVNGFFIYTLTGEYRLY